MVGTRLLDPADVALSFDQSPNDTAVRSVQRHLATKGFCVVSLAVAPAVAEGALSDIHDLDARGVFCQVNPVLADGLLGVDGSSRLAELDEKTYMPGQDLRVSLNTVTQSIGALVELVSPELQVDTQTLVHHVGDTTNATAPERNTKQAWDWLTTFMRNKLMVVQFMGPSRGTLELRPHQKEHAETYRVKTGPGVMVLLRPELLACAHFADGDAFAVSRFGLSAARRPGLVGGAVTPVVAELDALITRALQDGSEDQASGNEDKSLDPKSLPLEWQRSLRLPDAGPAGGDSVMVRGAAFRLPCAEELMTWHASSVAGPDWASEVPQLRWDHSEVYDPAAADNFVDGKVYCNHASFIDGLHLFDCKAFGLDVAEAAAMDPHQRMSLESGYSALFRGGKRRSTLKGSACSVFVGCGSTEWMLMHDSKQLHRSSAGSSSGQSACATRLCFQLGLQGQSLVLDAEGASGLAVLHLAAESIQRSTSPRPESSALAIGVHLCLSPVWWPSACSSGVLSHTGRCLSFNESADGYIRGEGCCAAMVDGAEQESDSDVQPLGCLAGSAMSSSGQYANLIAPSGASERDIIAEALSRAGVVPADVDCIQADSSGLLLPDALEVAGLTRVYRNFNSREVLTLASAKSSCGHQMECAGLTSFLEALIAASFGMSVPKLHLRTLNPHVDLAHAPTSFVGEAMELRDLSPYIGVNSLGFTGYRVHAIAWGQAAGKADKQVSSIENTIAFWPGGGGELTREMRPSRAYTVAGTWSDFEPIKMEFEGAGTYACTITLGSSGREEFNILLDGDRERILHPSLSHAGRDTAVLGPSTRSACEGSWLIDGSSPRDEDLAGSPGDKYRIQLRVAGRWRLVTWHREHLALGMT